MPTWRDREAKQGCSCSTRAAAAGDGGLRLQLPSACYQCTCTCFCPRRATPAPVCCDLMATAGAGGTSQHEHPATAQDDSFYWESYAHLQIHREMLQDKTRTETYKR
eukprot:SAG31_NODE_23001_length_513_cov_1.287440_1_plen_107_part_00